ncbi:MAG: ComEA family DNA-binding protein [Bryobacteraceae bacterium]
MRFAALVSIGVSLLAGTVKAELPPGPGRAVTVRVCGKCHSPDRVASLHQSKQAWENTISKMAQMGAQASEDDFYTILDYVTKNFGPLVNVNQATAGRLESSLDLTKAEADAIVQYRSKKGDFKSIADLKNVPDLDFKKIEAEKSSIVF